MPVAADAQAMVDLSDATAPQHWTYSELDSLADAVAGGLRAAGVAPGERVGLICSNSARAVAVLLGSMRAGCVAVPINPRAGAETLRFMCDDAAMTIVFSDAAGLGLVPANRQFLSLDGPQFESFLRGGAFEAFEPQADDPALILYTSGSTGRPKGVLLSHSSQVLIAAGYATAFMSECLDSGPAIVAAPLFHMNATVNTTHVFMLHGAFVLMPRFDAAGFIRCGARAYRVSLLSGVPTMTAHDGPGTRALARADLGNVKLVVDRFRAPVGHGTGAGACTVPGGRR